MIGTFRIQAAVICSCPLRILKSHALLSGGIEMPWIGFLTSAGQGISGRQGVKGLPHAKSSFSLKAHAQYPKKKSNMNPLILGLPDGDLFYSEVSSGNFIHTGCDGKGSWKNGHDPSFRSCNPVFRHMAKTYVDSPED
jgi:hypothetical protein